MESYWTRKTVSRRAALRAMGATGGAIAALSLIGCSDDGDSTAGTAPTGAPAQAVDSTKGKPGGRMVIQAPGYATTLVLVKTRNNITAGLAGFTHSALLSLRNGRPEFDGTDMTPQPDLAEALPEQNPDQLTYTFKLRPAKFHNGRTVTSQDVKYSLERYAKHPDSAYQQIWSWLDRVETPDPQTAVIKTKQPYADTIGSLVGWYDGFIMAQEHEEGPDAANKLMGSGPFMFVDTQAPIISRFKKNPDYFMQPYPYFDEVHMLGTADFAKKFADFSSKQVNMTYWHAEEERDQMKAARPDAKMFKYDVSGNHLVLRVDKPPFNDVRVRRALSLAINRQALKEATNKGEGEDDQAFSWTVKTWGHKKPSELGDAAQYWKYDIAAAKQLLSAAGVSDLKFRMAHWDHTVIGQAFVDRVNLIQAQLKQNLGVTVEDATLPYAQLFSTVIVGDYEGSYFFTGGEYVLTSAPGVTLRNTFTSPPEGVTVPTQNSGHVNDPELTAAAEKQLTQFNLEDRKKSFQIMADAMAKNMYRVVTNTTTNTYFADPRLANMQIPVTSVNGAVSSARFWWFDS